jgi:hypothetical protein
MSCLSVTIEAGFIIFDKVVMLTVQPCCFRVIIIIPQVAGDTVLFKDLCLCNNSILTGNLLINVIQAPGLGMQLAQKTSELMAVKAFYIIMRRLPPGYNIGLNTMTKAAKRRFGGNKIRDHKSYIR